MRVGNQKEKNLNRNIRGVNFKILCRMKEAFDKLRRIDKLRQDVQLNQVCLFLLIIFWHIPFSSLSSVFPSFQFSLFAFFPLPFFLNKQTNTHTHTHILAQTSSPPPFFPQFLSNPSRRGSLPVLKLGPPSAGTRSPRARTDTITKREVEWVRAEKRRIGEKIQRAEAQGNTQEVCLPNFSKQ